MNNVGNAMLIIGSLALAIIFEDSINPLGWILLTVVFLFGVFTWTMIDKYSKQIAIEKEKLEIELLRLKIEKLRQELERGKNEKT